MKKIAIIILITVFLSMIGGCYDPYLSFNRYPWYLSEEWYCAEIDMTIFFSFDEKGDLMPAEPCQLTIGDIVYDVNVGFQHNAIGFSVDENKDGIYEIVLDGTWMYRDGNLVVQIYEERIFSGQYSELIFVPS